MSKYILGKNLILQQTNKRAESMTVDITTVVPVPGLIERLFNALFELHLCAIEPVRPVHKNHGGW